MKSIGEDVKSVGIKLNKTIRAQSKADRKREKKQDRAEALRIKTDIATAADGIRAGIPISEARFLILEESFVYYRDVLKKNSFIVKEFEFVSE